MMEKMGVGVGKQLQKGPRAQRWEEAWVWVSEEGKGPMTLSLPPAPAAGTQGPKGPPISPLLATPGPRFPLQLPSSSVQCCRQIKGPPKMSTS